MFSGYSLAWHVPQVLRDGRQRTISAKRSPSKTPQAPRQQPFAGRCGSSEGRTVASWREPSEVRSGPRQTCKMQWAAMQAARFHRRRPDALTTTDRHVPGGYVVRHPDMKHRAACTIGAASSCILQMKTRSGGVGAFDPVRLFRSWLNRKREEVVADRAFARFSKETSPNPIHRPPSRNTPGTPHAKGCRTDMNPDQKKEHVKKNR